MRDTDLFTYKLPCLHSNTVLSYCTNKIMKNNNEQAIIMKGTFI